MKKLNNIILFVVFMFILSSSLNAKKIRGEYATKNIEGQNYYLKNCASCHGEGSRGGNMASINEWKELFSNEASELIYLHEEDEELVNIIKYFKSNKFKNESNDMLKFLQEFAYDSDNIPTCN